MICSIPGMTRTIPLYGLALGLAVFALDWLDYRHTVRDWPTELYVTCIALGFTALGIWAGNRLTARPRRPDFERNHLALDALGMSARECEVLGLIADGHSNKVIARRLSISPNTVKTHVARVFEKLEVQSRTQAISKARSLDILS